MNETTKASEDTLGDRLKAREQVWAGQRFQDDMPLMVRLDGKAFHTFTRGLQRPYDARLSKLMEDTTAYLIGKTHARLGYTQSDEISLCWWNTDPQAESSYMFDGKIQKLTSVLAGMASAYFTKMLPERIPEKSNEIVVFDCRAWSVENLHEVYLNFLWRQDDAIKNSISMAAQAHFSHKVLMGVGSEAKKQMLREIHNPWENEPQFFKMGTFVQRVTRNVELTPEQLAKIPEKHRPTGPVVRSFVENINLGYIKDNPKARTLFE
jgi:tRNA(His) 5'-end guanylyltransferase